MIEFPPRTRVRIVSGLEKFIGFEAIVGERADGKITDDVRHEYQTWLEVPPGSVRPDSAGRLPFWWNTDRLERVLTEIPKFTSIAEADAWMEARTAVAAPRDAHQHGDQDQFDNDHFVHPEDTEGNVLDDVTSCHCLCEECAHEVPYTSYFHCICPYGCNFAEHNHTEREQT